MQAAHDTTLDREGMIVLEKHGVDADGIERPATVTSEKKPRLSIRFCGRHTLTSGNRCRTTPPVRLPTGSQLSC